MAAEQPGKIFVGGLARETTDSGFTVFFSKFGQILDSTIMRDRVTGTPRGFGFITFADKSSVDRVMAEKATLTLDGRRVDCKVAFSKGSGTPERTAKIFVGGILPTTTNEELKAYFDQFGTVRQASIMFDSETSRSRGFGFVNFESEDAVDTLLQRTHSISGKVVECKKAVPKTRMGNNPQQGYGGPGFGGAASDPRGGYGEYGARGGYGAPYGAPYGGPPGPGYGAPAGPGYGAPPGPGYGAPAGPGYGAAPGYYGAAPGYGYGYNQGYGAPPVAAASPAPAAGGYTASPYNGGYPASPAAAAAPAAAAGYGAARSARPDRSFHPYQR